jgi:hypothetical protein
MVERGFAKGARELTRHEKRMRSEREMMRQIMDWNRPDPVASEPAFQPIGEAAIRRAAGSEAGARH